MIGTNYILQRRTKESLGISSVRRSSKTVAFPDGKKSQGNVILGAVCSRASRVDLLESYAFESNIRFPRYRGLPLSWAQYEFGSPC